MREFPADDGRLAELVLHVSERCAGWEHFDPILLDRILFQSDFLHYRRYGVPITGQTYRRGPCGPAPRGLGRVLRGLARDFAMRETPAGDGLHVHRRPAALRAARLSEFAADELATVGEVLEHYRKAGPPAGQGLARPETDLLPIPWDQAGPREPLSYAWALAGTVPGGDAQARADIAAGTCA